jgi:hypothetical protein
MPTELEQRLTQFVKLCNLNAPNCIKAHYLVKVLVPNIVRECNMIPEFADEMANMLARGMAVHSGVCVFCKKARATCDYLCPRCNSEYNSMVAEMEG